MPREVPSVVVPFDCSDKRLKERWTEKRAQDLANFPSPFRMLLLGPPGGGKSTLIKNMVIHQRPRFDEVYVIHEDFSEDPSAPGTTEYDDLDPTAMMSEVPDHAFWNEVTAGDSRDKPPVKRLVILDDLEMKGRPERLRNLQTLFRYVSSHKGISVCMAHQNFFSLEPVIKNNANIFFVWKPKNRDEVGLIERRVGLPKGVLSLIYSYLSDVHDSICIDHTANSPAPLRINLFTPLS